MWWWQRHHDLLLRWSRLLVDERWMKSWTDLNSGLFQSQTLHMSFWKAQDKKGILTVSASTHQNQQENIFTTRKITFWIGLSRVWNQIWLNKKKNIFVVTRRRLCATSSQSHRFGEQFSRQMLTSSDLGCWRTLTQRRWNAEIESKCAIVILRFAQVFTTPKVENI